ncbi:MAG: hypothetical protein HWQ43_17525 [Nostoc sp. JL31]|uniref:hypothetical protein n=1 Tax=Nostoc sp. JL31 TaxID=2815395 RepID=UPI0025F2E2E1|nr:hypothetical protein [Nostoc sp. JL31]MBN3890868.1 hypothetical protein [Nostoc sp. JL31]
MNQKVDLSSLALILEKILALIATHLNVEPVQLVLITTGELEEEFSYSEFRSKAGDKRQAPVKIN